MPREGVTVEQVLKVFKRLKAEGGTNEMLAKELGLSPQSLATKLTGIRLAMFNATAKWKVDGKEMTGAEYAETYGIHVKDMASQTAVDKHNKARGSSLVVPELVADGYKLGSLAKSHSASKYTNMAQFAQGLIDSLDPADDEDEDEGKSESAAE